jgi:hypothetical protein
MRKPWIVFVLLLPVLCLNASATSPPATPPPATPPPATLADAAWLAGTWQGEGLGGWVEDVWGEPRAGAMPGMFRLVKDGSVVFYEILSIVEKDGSLELRLKHFNADLTGWEEKDKVLAFPLSEKSEGKLRFGGISYARTEDGLLCVVAIRGKDGVVREEPFRFVKRPG